MSNDKSAVRRILDHVKAAGRTTLTAPEARGLCEAYGIAIPREGVVTNATDAATLAAKIGFPVVMKIVSPQILHKTEAGGVLVSVKWAEEAAFGIVGIRVGVLKDVMFRLAPASQEDAFSMLASIVNPAGLIARPLRPLPVLHRAGTQSTAGGSS